MGKVSAGGKEYIIAFSSFYKAAYAQDMLSEAGINATLRKLPTELVRSCGTGLYMRSESAEPAQLVFAEKQISPRGIYEINRGVGGEKNYIKIK